MTLVVRSMRTPLESNGTTTIGHYRCGSPSGSDFHIIIANMHDGLIAPLDHQLQWFSRKISLSSAISREVAWASEGATSGSVIEQTEQISPAKNGFNRSSRTAPIAK